MFDRRLVSITIDAERRPMLQSAETAEEAQHTARRTDDHADQLSSVFDALPRFFTISMMLRM